MEWGKAAPDWNLPQQFVVNELHSAMQFDTSPNVHPMNNRVVEPEAIADSFDGIAYGKCKRNKKIRWPNDTVMMTTNR